MAGPEKPGQHSPLGFVKAIDPILRLEAYLRKKSLANCLRGGFRKALPWAGITGRKVVQIAARRSGLSV